MPDLEKFVKRRVRDFVREKYGVRQMPELKGTTRDLVPLVNLERAKKTITNTIGMRLTLIPAGTLLMGSPDDEKDADNDEKPQHSVRITRPFYLGVHEVTQAQYQAVMGKNPSYFSATGGGKDKVAGRSTDQYPVESVSWLDAVTYCNRLSEKEGLKPFYEISGETVRAADWKGPGYRLPTEAEWEYACRAGARTRYSFGEDAAGLGEHAWYDGNSGASSHLVGERRGNAFGVFDMHGNVWEWCWDRYGDYKSDALMDDPTGPLDGSDRVRRGGSWYIAAECCRAAYRSRLAPTVTNRYLGLRLARVPSSR